MLDTSHIPRIKEDALLTKKLDSVLTVKDTRRSTSKPLLSRQSSRASSVASFRSDGSIRRENKAISQINNLKRELLEVKKDKLEAETAHNQLVAKNVVDFAEAAVHYRTQVHR